MRSTIYADLMTDSERILAVKLKNDDPDRFRRLFSDVWLPDAVSTLQTIILESDWSSSERMAFLCDHLRRCAHSVSANDIVLIAGAIQQALQLGQGEQARSIAGRSIATLCLYSARVAAA
jgi:hypothetical protein